MTKQEFLNCMEELSVKAIELSSIVRFIDKLVWIDRNAKLASEVLDGKALNALRENEIEYEFATPATVRSNIYAVCHEYRKKIYDLRRALEVA